MPIVADLSQGVPDEIKANVKSLLADLGNSSAALPFYALFPADGSAPVVIADGPVLQGALIERLESAIGGLRPNVDAAAARY